jgi:hypothetical protein
MTQITPNLLHSVARSPQWAGIEYDERIGIAGLAAVEAERNWNPNRGQFSTVAITYIRNALKNETAKHQTRMKYDGVQVSCLLPSQIPAAEMPDVERTVMFRDKIAKLPPDAKVVAAMLLNATATKHSLQDAKRKLRAAGWSVRKVQKACNEVRALLTDNRKEI